MGTTRSLWDSAQARKTAVIPSLRTASPCKPQESQEKCTLLPQRVLVQRPPNIISIRATKRFGYTTSQRASLASSVTARLPTNITRISCSNQHPPPHLETGIENQLPSCMPANAYPVTSLRQSSAAKKNIKHHHHQLRQLLLASETPAGQRASSASAATVLVGHAAVNKHQQHQWQCSFSKTSGQKASSASAATVLVGHAAVNKHQQHQWQCAFSKTSDQKALPASVATALAGHPAVNKHQQHQ